MKSRIRGKVCSVEGQEKTQFYPTNKQESSNGLGKRKLEVTPFDFKSCNLDDISWLNCASEYHQLKNGSVYCASYNSATLGCI